MLYYIILYADDTGLYTSSKDVSRAEQRVNDDLERIDEWLTQNGLVSNTKKSEVMLIGSRPSVENTCKLQILILFNGKSLNQPNHFRYLDVNIDSCLNWNYHISSTASRIYPKLKLLNRISSFLSHKILLNIYKQTILPVLGYGCIVWGSIAVNAMLNAWNVYKIKQCALFYAQNVRHVHRKCVQSWFYCHLRIGDGFYGCN